MVVADGSVVRIDEAHEPDLVPAVALGLGALGVVTEYELQCVPAFLLTAHERPDRLSAVLDGLEARVRGADHFEFYWFPHTDRVLTKHNTRIDDLSAAAPLPGWRQRLDDDLLSNTVFEGLNRVARRAPLAVPALNAVASRGLSERRYTDRAHRVFATQRSVRFTETEFSVPIDQVGWVLQELRRWLRRSGERVAFPLEVRFAAPDDRWLSTSWGRESAYIAVHQYHRASNEAWFSAFWDVVRGLGDARPHWGKMHPLLHDDLRGLYPRMDEFVALRDRFDPERTFGNPHLERVLGR